MQYIYKFRVYYDEVEDFSRDIEILSSDNFESFHHILFSSIGLTGNELSSFFICDTKWNKQKEITLIDMGDDTETVEPEYDDEDFGAQSHLPKFVMKESVLKTFISDPHQHIIYEYDFLNPKTFYIELLKTLQAEDGIEYPRCTSSVKTLPKETPKNIHLEDPLEELLEDEEDDDMNSGYGDGYDEEDYSNLDGFGDFNEF